jgi:hypothetical protein
MIAFHDFIPRRQGRRLLGVLTDYENLHALVSRVNRWIEQHHIDVLNVETVVVTSLPQEAGCSHASLRHNAMNAACAASRSAASVASRSLLMLGSTQSPDEHPFVTTG